MTSLETKFSFSFSKFFFPETQILQLQMASPSNASSSSEKMVRLRSSDLEVFDLEVAVAMQSQTIRYMIEDDCADSEIPVPNVKSNILSKVIEYCEKHVDIISIDELRNWDSEYMKVDREMLIDLILAANFLEIKGLMDLTCQTAAELLKQKTPDQLCQMFNVKSDFTQEEEEEIQREQEQRCAPEP